jgi:hypothetical protein
MKKVLIDTVVQNRNARMKKALTDTVVQNRNARMKKALTDKDTTLPKAERRHNQVAPSPPKCIPIENKGLYTCMILTTGPVNSTELPCNF